MNYNKAKICHVNTSDSEGGAARAAYRLHIGLLNNKINSTMFVQHKKNDDYTVHQISTKYQKIMSKLRPFLDSVPKSVYRNKMSTPWSVGWLTNSNVEYINSMQPNIVNLHWINGGFIANKDLLNINSPIIWTLHDMWSFTGGCHYSGNCIRYTHSCGQCEQLGSAWANDLSSFVHSIKEKLLRKRKLEFTIVTPSKWLAMCAKKSSLFNNFPIVIIPSAIDIDLYKPIDKIIARNILKLPYDKKLILFGAMNATSDKRKGFQYLEKSLQYLSTTSELKDVEIVVFGTSGSNYNRQYNFKINYVGRLYDDFSLALAYSSADVFVAPSLEENLANTIIESLSCGTPCVAFNIGGMPDMIEHLRNGYLANPLDTEDLAKGIMWVLNDKERWCELSQNARNKAVHSFDMNIVAQKYISLYKEVLSKRGY